MTRLRLIRDRSGQSLVELAFISPVLISLLFGAAEYGRLCYVSIEVTNAAHAAAEYGSQNRGTASDNSGMSSAATNDGANLTSLMVTPQHLCAATYSDTPTTDCSGTPAVEYVQVKHSGNGVFPISFLWLRGKLHIAWSGD